MTEKQKLYEKANDLVKQGLNLTQAAKQVGVPLSSFYSWRSEKGVSKKKSPNSPKKIMKKPTLEVINLLKPDTQVFCVIGTPAEVAEVINKTRLS